MVKSKINYAEEIQIFPVYHEIGILKIEYEMDPS